VLSNIYAVKCQICGESQNTVPGGFDPRAEPFGPVTCMVCNNQFSQTDYLAGLDAKASSYMARTGPKSE
jgi:hypothetical protein